MRNAFTVRGEGQRLDNRPIKLHHVYHNIGRKALAILAQPHIGFHLACEDKVASSVIEESPICDAVGLPYLLPDTMGRADKGAWRAHCRANGCRTAAVSRQQANKRTAPRVKNLPTAD